MYSKINHGGSEAIRGFSFQDAVIVFLLFCNVKDINFWVVPEGQEDIDVFFENILYFLQVKSQDLSISKIIAKKKNKQGELQSSILEKLHCRNTEGVCKLVCTKCKDIDEKQDTKSTIFSLENTYIVFNVRKFDIASLDKNKVFQNTCTEHQLKIKEYLKNTTVFETPFTKEYNSYYFHLIGVLNNTFSLEGENVCRNTLASIKQLLVYKQTIKHENSETYDMKKITTQDILPFVKVSKKSESFKNLLKELKYGDLQSQEIIKSKSEIQMPLTTDYSYNVLEQILDSYVELTHKRYDIREYLTMALSHISTKETLHLSQNQLIARVVMYYIEKEYRYDI